MEDAEPDPVVTVTLTTYPILTAEEAEILADELGVIQGELGLEDHILIDATEDAELVFHFFEPDLDVPENEATLRESAGLIVESWMRNQAGGHFWNDETRALHARRGTINLRDRS